MRAVYEWSARHLPFDMRHSIIEKCLNALIMVSGGSKQTNKPTGIHTHVRIAVTQYGARPNYMMYTYIGPQTQPYNNYTVINPGLGEEG